MMSNNLSEKSPVTALPGFGPKRAALLKKLGIETVGDFLLYFPRDYEDRSRITTLMKRPEEGKACYRLILAAEPTSARIAGGREMVKVRAFDDTNSIDIIFFNRAYIKNQLVRGREYIFFGKVEENGRRLSMINPVFEEEGKSGGVTGRILPVYPLSAGLTSAMISQGAKAALEVCRTPESPLPLQLMEELGLPSSESAYSQIHFPDSLGEAAAAARRFVTEELYVFCAASIGLKRQSKTKISRSMERYSPEEFYKKLPFEPTNAQKRAVEEAFFDMTSPYRMNRLVQGDVGSGKTLVAAACAWLCKKNGRQAVIMAPTELLARQHVKTLKSMMAPFGINVGLLISAMTAAEKRAALAAARDGETDIICGTHALIQEGVAFKDVGLFVVDEQHRFGVAQRSRLAQKAPESHMMVMSATPIPRTLSLIIFGDLDLSVIDELPSGRRPIETYSVGEDKRKRAMAFLLKQVQQGGQAYIVCPIIEDSEENDRASAESYAAALSKAMPMLRVGLLHGRMTAEEKEAVMADFAARRLDVLVSTTVIEVGIDVPNANLIIIEDCESFGLSQLHQLRGRVGRGERQSYCVLMRKGPRSPRIEVICNTNDGFKIAEEDLRLRGPGDFFGHRQHGLPAFKLADLSKDMSLFERARTAAEETFRRDPLLNMPENAELKRRVEALLAEGNKIN